MKAISATVKIVSEPYEIVSLKLHCLLEFRSVMSNV